MAVRRQSSVRASVTGQANVLAQRKTNSSIEAALAALRFGISGVPLCTIARFTRHLPDQTPTQTEPQLMHRITSLKYYRREKHGEDLILNSKLPLLTCKFPEICVKP